MVAAKKSAIYPSDGLDLQAETVVICISEVLQLAALRQGDSIAIADDDMVQYPDVY